MKPNPCPPAGAPPPPSHRAVLAVVAVVAASVLNGALLAVFDRNTPASMRLATPALERAREDCGAQRARADRHRCRLDVARGIVDGAPLATAVAAADPGQPAAGPLR